MRTRWQMAWAGAAGLGALAVFYARYIEPAQVYLDRFSVAVDRPGLPAAGLTILHLTDLHCRAHDAVQSVMLTRLARSLAGEPYDLLLVTGDLLHNTAGMPAALAFLATLRPRLAAFSCPGNRDYWESSFAALLGSPVQRAGKSRAAQVALAGRQVLAFVRRTLRNERWSLHIHSNDVDVLHAALAGQGIQPLVNRAVHMRTGDVDLWIAGVDDLTQGEPDVAAALADIPDGALTILLAHNPDTALDPRVQRACLMLAGHTHGGQLRLPGIGALYSQGSHLPRRRLAGWFERGETRLFVGRGLGQSFPLRFGAPPQAALIRLTSTWEAK